MLDRLPEMTRRWRSGQISDAAYAAIYFLQWQVETHGNRFASRRDRRDAAPNAGEWFDDLGSLPGDALDQWLAEKIGRSQFTGIIANVPVALCAWLHGHWPIRLCEFIPSPRQVLGMQGQGTRPVTILSDPARARRPVLSKPNSFAFMVHDLEHVYKFFHEPELHSGQVRFFRALEIAEVSDVFSGLKKDNRFCEKFDYLMSDMNTHVAHSLQYLRAILIEAMLRREMKQPSDTLSPEGETQVEMLMSGMTTAIEAQP